MKWAIHEELIALRRVFKFVFWSLNTSKCQQDGVSREAPCPLFLIFLVEFINAVTQVNPLSFPLYIVTMRNCNCSHSITQTGKTNILNSRHGNVYWTSLFKHSSGTSNSVPPTKFIISDLQSLPPICIFCSLSQK